MTRWNGEFMVVPDGPSLRDKLADRGWVECLQCEDLEGCDQCLDGLAPPGEMVEAAAKGAWEANRLPSSGRWEDEWVENGLLLRPRFRAALIATARWEREQ